MNLLSTIITSFLVTFIMLYIMEDLLGNKTKKNFKKFIIPYLLLTLITIFECFILNQTIRIMILCISFIIYIKFVYKQNFQRAILTSIFYQLIVMVSELLFSIISIMILDLNIENLLTNPVYSIIINFVISLINVILVKIPFIKKVYHYLIKVTSKISSKQLMFFSMALILIANLLTGILYYRVEFIYLLIFNTSLTLFCFFIIIYNFNTQNKYIKVYDKYNTTLNSLKEYEDILDRYKISNHENKNELLTIRNMLPKSDKKIISYIDKVVDNKLKDNEKVMFEVSRIPAGGLRGLIYSKILLMKENNIDYELLISKDVRTIDFIKLDESLILDICKVIGVYLDNAIDAVKVLEIKSILIEMYIDKNNLIISISNNFSGVLQLDKLEQKGYTSKGDNHGYGLSLAKEIINSNKKLENEKRINKDIFTQVLKIKM